jgi:hypothetical protein
MCCHPNNATTNPKYNLLLIFKLIEFKDFFLFTTCSNGRRIHAVGVDKNKDVDGNCNWFQSLTNIFLSCDMSGNRGTEEKEQPQKLSSAGLTTSNLCTFDFLPPSPISAT